MGRALEVDAETIGVEPTLVLSNGGSFPCRAPVFFGEHPPLWFPGAVAHGAVGDTAWPAETQLTARRLAG